MAFITQSEVIASRSMNYLYIYLDIAFLCLLAGLLIWQKKYQALLVGLFGGLLYFAVDYGIFYAWLGTRRVEGADTALFLLWLSMSYGFTNFVWIWLWLDRDSRLLEWSLLIPLAWFSEALISQFAVYIFGEVVVFLFVLHPLFRAFAELTILALFCFYRMRPAVVRYVFRTVKIQEKVAVAGVKGIYIFTARIRVNSVNGIYRTAILTN